MRKEKLEELNSYIEELKTVKKVKSNINPSFLTVERFDNQLNNGLTISKEKILKGGKDGSAAIILPLTKENETILVVQPRINTKETVSIELPAGYIEENELPDLAAKRELLEETGYVPEEIKLLTSYYQDQGCSSAYNYSFIGLNCIKKYKQNLDKDEIIKYFECSYEEAIELAEMGYIKDVNSLITLEKSKNYLKNRGVKR